MALIITNQTVEIDDLVSVIVSDVVANADATGFVRKFDFFTDALDATNRAPILTILVTATDKPSLEVATPTLSF